MTLALESRVKSLVQGEEVKDEGGDQLFVICLEKKRDKKDNMRFLIDFLEGWEGVALRQICVLLFSNEDSDNLQEVIKEKLGLMNFFRPNLQTSCLPLLLEVAQNLGDIKETMTLNEYIHEKPLESK